MHVAHDPLPLFAKSLFAHPQLFTQMHVRQFCLPLIQLALQELVDFSRRSEQTKIPGKKANRDRQK